MVGRLQWRDRCDEVPTGLWFAGLRGAVSPSHITHPSKSTIRLTCSLRRLATCGFMASIASNVSGWSCFRLSTSVLNEYVIHKRSAWRRRRLTNGAMSRVTARLVTRYPCRLIRSPAWVERELAGSVFRDGRLGTRFRLLLRGSGAASEKVSPSFARTRPIPRPLIASSPMSGSVRKIFWPDTSNRREGVLLRQTGPC